MVFIAHMLGHTCILRDFTFQDSFYHIFQLWLKFRFHRRFDFLSVNTLLNLYIGLFPNGKGYCEIYQYD